MITSDYCAVFQKMQYIMSKNAIWQLSPLTIISIFGIKEKLKNQLLLNMELTKTSISKEVINRNL
jgi:hypothetical protein